MSNVEVAASMATKQSASIGFGSEYTTQMCEFISAQIPGWRERVRELVQNHRSYKVSDVTVEQIYGGLRGVITQATDISFVDPQHGIRIRGFTIQELLDLLPKVPGSIFPLVGGLYYLLLVNSIPTLEQALAVEEEWKKRSAIPEYVFQILRTMPAETHPMTLFSLGILSLEKQSVFPDWYSTGPKRTIYWKAILEDSFNLVAKLPTLAAFIFNLKYRDGIMVPPDPSLDWGGSFSAMIGKGDDPEFVNLCRLFFLIHCDHESGNVSAHAATLVGSSLADIYYACSAAMDGLAGPLHGLANQEALQWLMQVRKDFHGNPTHEQLEKYIWDELNSGKVIPGYGHAVLRTTDPRFTAFLEFGQKYLPDDELYQLVTQLYDILPGILTRFGKVKNPYPNVDAISGTLLNHYGLGQFDFYTVMFGVSRILGLTSNVIWSRALEMPIERPRSITTKMLEDLVAGSPAS